MSESLREEITRLEALYAGNPGGRVFTHLAEAYRKAGELDRAREVLDGGLRHHGDYASAYVVLGRVLMDMGETDEARSAFRRVIELDRHNLIALRSLGDLAIVARDTPEALRQYRELLALDPADELLQATVARLESSPPAPAGVAEDAEPGEMTTETLAELYAAQGLHVRAAEVYRSLLRARPGDERLQEKLRTIESLNERDERDRATSPVPVVGADAEHESASQLDDKTPSWLEHVESAWTGSGGGVAGARPTPYAWTEAAHSVRTTDDGVDRPISAYFEGLLAWRPADPVASEPAQVASGEEVAGGVDGRDADRPEDVAADEPDAAPDEPYERHEPRAPSVWLDDVASEPVRGEAEPADVGTALTPRDVDRGGTPAAPTPRDVRRAGTPAVEEDEELEMFRSWLQSLKK